MEKKERTNTVLNYETMSDAARDLNGILWEVHQQELALRRNISRPFEITSDINSNPYCHIFKGLNVEIKGQPMYISTDTRIKVGNGFVQHVFFINRDGNIIDPTFGQHLRKIGIDPEDYRKAHPLMFVENIFVGKVSDMQDIKIDYFPNKIKR